jgi:hypothetical protein
MSSASCRITDLSEGRLDITQLPELPAIGVKSSRESLNLGLQLIRFEVRSDV